jgi:hypothetical protein
MGVALFLVVGVSLTALFMVATRPAAHPALAGDNTVVGLRDAASETLVGGTSVCNDWKLATVDDLTDAEDLLDNLEACGHADRELVILGNSSFAVRWR